ncbi:Importin beta-like protein [Smittium mucronatum]|uniref:Importin beta-like protein n=1 Tax=Smittium mucronatum TaxID=133383 RepID=A0A1R0GZI7_9FUNG|nr:Importin beta-like protein [Smittium mucronatum]
MKDISQDLIQCLEQILTGDPVVTKLAEEKLEILRSVIGFHFNLQSIYLDKSFPDQIRFIAAINFKNGVSRYWRNTSVG